MTGHSHIYHYNQSAPNNASRHINSSDAYHQYTCPRCEVRVQGAVIAATHDYMTRWLNCTNCDFGSVLNYNELSPHTKEGEHVEGLPDDVAAAYEEARKNASIGSFTSCDLMCRKILMHVAVDKGAQEGETFKHYLSHLEGSGYITPPMKPWVDRIRENGNSATHELPATDRSRALDSLTFTAQLLRMVYEMEYKYAQSLKLTQASQSET